MSRKALSGRSRGRRRQRVVKQRTVAVSKPISDSAMLDLLPAELVHGLCEQMDIKSLSQFVATSQRHKAVCQRVLEQRRAQYEQPLTLQQVLDRYILGPPHTREYARHRIFYPNPSSTRVVEASAAQATRIGDAVRVSIYPETAAGRIDVTKLVDVGGYAVYSLPLTGERTLLWSRDIGLDRMKLWNERMLG